MISPTMFSHIPRTEATADNRLFSKEAQTFTSMLLPQPGMSFPCSLSICDLSIRTQIKCHHFCEYLSNLSNRINSFSSLPIACCHYLAFYFGLPCMLILGFSFFESLSLLFVIFLRAEHLFS